MMLVLFWSNFSIFVSQMCFCFFFTCGSVSPALASGYCTIFWSTFTVPRFPIMVVGGALLQDLIFSRGPFSGPHLGKPLSQGHPFEATWGKGPSLSCSWKVQASSSSFFFLWSLGATLQAQAPICCCCWPHAILLAVAWLWA